MPSEGAEWFRRGALSQNENPALKGASYKSKLRKDACCYINGDHGRAFSRKWRGSIQRMAL